jgi:hypothetical protein
MSSELANRIERDLSGSPKMLEQASEHVVKVLLSTVTGRWCSTSSVHGQI